ncbi:MAG: radical SAM protein, partial [Nitrospinales bacterium]
MSQSDEPAKIKAAVLDSILADDLRKARALLPKENPEELRLLAELLIKAENQTPPLMDLKARAPLYLSISASYTCGLRCEMCNSGFHDRTRLYEDYSYFLPEQFDALPEWNDSAKHVFFVGMGETLDSPHIPYFLKRLNGQMSTVITSGVPLNRRMLESLIESKLKILNLSFDGKTSAGHGGGKESYIQKFWAKVESVQKVKKELGRESPRIALSITVNGENIGQLEEI